MPSKRNSRKFRKKRKDNWKSKRRKESLNSSQGSNRYSNEGKNDRKWSNSSPNKGYAPKACIFLPIQETYRQKQSTFVHRTLKKISLERATENGRSKITPKTKTIIHADKNR